MTKLSFLGIRGLEDRETGRLLRFSEAWALALLTNKDRWCIWVGYTHVVSNDVAVCCVDLCVALVALRPPERHEPYRAVHECSQQQRPSIWGGFSAGEARARRVQDESSLQQGDHRNT